jgi:hypothetical protein
MTPKRREKPEMKTLTGWRQISEFLGEPESVVHRWKKQGMPVHRQGRQVTATVPELNAWLGADSAQPVQVATEETDLASKMKRAVSFVRHRKLSR